MSLALCASDEASGNFTLGPNIKKKKFLIKINILNLKIKYNLVP